MEIIGRWKRETKNTTTTLDEEQKQLNSATVALTPEGVADAETRSKNVSESRRLSLIYVAPTPLYLDGQFYTSFFVKSYSGNGKDMFKKNHWLF